MTKFILLTAALALTVVLAVTVDKYKVTSGELLSNRGFEQGLKDWKIDGTPSALTVKDGVLVVELREPGKSVEIEQPIAKMTTPGFVLLEGELKSLDVVPGEKPWHRARLDFSRYGTNGKWLPLPHNVISLEGSTEWQHYQEIFRLVEGVGKSVVTIQMLSATGELWVRNLSLHRVVPATGYKVARAALFLMWASVLILLFGPHVIGGKRKFLGVMTGLVVIIIVIGTMLPASFKTRWQGEIKDLVLAGENHLTTNHSGLNVGTDSEHSEQIYLVGDLEISKVGHFVFFGLLGFLVLARGGKGSILPQLAETAVLGAATELMQFFVEGRTPLVSDFLTDMAGVATGLLICLIFLRCRRLLSDRR